ncbi:MAG: FHA domain-containing protein [Cyanobacteria bacterium HKST-UBA04]|nr:FHA domain-containing protein [Cyanobacteria bacterium HKST-UBA04]
MTAFSQNPATSNGERVSPPYSTHTLLEPDTEAAALALLAMLSTSEATQLGCAPYRPTAGNWLYGGPAITDLNAILGWKLHIWADSMADWLQVAQVALPLLNQLGLPHKTIACADMLAAMDHSVQEGKAFTVYTTSVAELKTCLHALDMALMVAGCKHPHRVHITGDKAIGHSGRLFYRYDRDAQGAYRLNDGQYKPQDLPDPFAYWPVESQLAQLPVGYMMILGRQYTGAGLWSTRISRCHARVERQEAGLLVSDAGSANGVWTEGQRIDTPVLLVPGQTFTLASGDGSATLMVLAAPQSFNLNNTNSPTPRP